MRGMAGDSSSGKRRSRKAKQRLQNRHHLIIPAQDPKNRHGANTELPNTSSNPPKTEFGGKPAVIFEVGNPLHTAMADAALIQQRPRRTLLDLPAEVRLNIYKQLEVPVILSITLDGRQNTVGHARRKCISSKLYPLLHSNRTIRRGFLAYLLSVTQLTLMNGIRPRIRFDPRRWPMPSWQLCNIQHVRIDTTKKMQFDFFHRLKTLTLLWLGQPLVVQATAAWKPGLGGVLGCENGTSAMADAGSKALKDSGKTWIEKLLKRRKKRFRLQMEGVFGCKDHMGRKGNGLMKAVIDVDKKRLVERKSDIDPAMIVEWWSHR